MAEVASAYVSLIPSAKGFATGVTKQTDAAARTASKRFGGIFSGGLKSVIGGALAGVGVTKLIGDALGEAREAQKVGALTTQVIKSTGGAAHVTAAQVGDLATSISNKVGVDDEAIQSGANLLLTFKNIRNEAGKGNKIFNLATKAATDLGAGMAAASGGTINFRSASTLVGKALNDPIKGVTALTRVGVTFTDGQKKQIKAMVESGHVMGAQKVILKELKSEFGGAAAAQATAGDKARVAWKNLEEQVGTAALPVLDSVANRLTKDVIPAVSEFVTQMQDGTGAGGEFVSVLKDTVGIGKSIVDFFTGLPGPVKKYGVEILVASVAIGKLNSGLGGMASRLSVATSSFRSAEGRSAKLSAGLQGLGGVLRNVAGAGGMLLLADSSKRTSTGMGTLEAAAGGALSGAALGAFAGPPGAAIGAALGGLGGAAFSLAQHVDGAGHDAKVSLPSWKQYEQTLNGVAAATTKATREMVFQRLEQSGLLTATRELGLTDRQAVAAMMGNTAQRKRLSDALRNQNVLTKDQEAALRKETGALGSSRLAQLKKNVATAQGKEELQKARTALRNFMNEPASKRVSITGVEDAKAQLNSLRTAIDQVWARAKDANVAGSGGLDVLLNPKHRAMGGSVTAGQPYIVGERRPELFVPNQSGRIIPRVPTAGTATSVVDAEQATYRAVTRALSATGTVIMSRDNLRDLDLLVGTA